MAKDTIIEKWPVVIYRKQKKKIVPQTSFDFGFGSLLDFSEKPKTFSKIDLRLAKIPPFDSVRYRTIGSNECLQLGDEFWECDSNKWIHTSFVGKPPIAFLGFKGAHLLYRRPIKFK